MDSVLATDAPEECPSCGALLHDLRSMGFNALKMVREGLCFLWADGQYNCATEQRKRDLVRYVATYAPRGTSG